MKIKKSIIFLIFMINILFVAFWFSQHRNQLKSNLKTEVTFFKPPLFLNESLVNKMLTQNFRDEYSLQKDSLDLNMLENKLKSIPEIQNVEIFISNQGFLSIQITEREPLFKVDSDPPYFSDSNGFLFKHKALDSIKFPLFKTTSSTISLTTTASLIQNLKSDPFLAKELKTIILKENQYHLKLKSYDFEVVFGVPKKTKEKIKKLKVFCAFQKTQDNLLKFKKINLSYNKQVVASIH